MCIRIFLFVSVTLISVLPIVNIIKLGIPENDGIEEKIEKLYFIDFVEGYLNNILYCFGISSNSTQVIIGRNGWLFLGDEYANNITEFREGSDTKKDISNKIIDAQIS